MRRRETGLTRRQFLFDGWSMGGYGANRAAETSPGTFCGLCAVSPALWLSFGDGVGDAFDSATEFAAIDVYAHVDRLTSPDRQTAGLFVRVDCGEQDPFREATAAFLSARPFKPMGDFSPGGHNDAYWRKVAPADIEFIWRSLFFRFGAGRVSLRWRRQALHRTCRPAAVEPATAHAMIRVQRGMSLAAKRLNRQESERS